MYYTSIIAGPPHLRSRINRKHSSLTYQPVVFLHVNEITFSQYLALLTMAGTRRRW